MAFVIAVGSTNPAKVGAAQAMLGRAFPDCRVIPADVASGVPDQPIGAAQTATGARRRALGALAAVPGAQLGLGLEGGMEPGGHLINCCAVAGADGRRNLAWGVRFPLPPAVVARVLNGDELGPVMDAVSGIPQSKQKLGAVGILTDGLFHREEMWQGPIACALMPFLHPELYPGPEMGSTPVTRDFTVATFVVHDGKTLMVYHKKLQMWLPPGGHIDPNELPDEAAVREVREETGLDVELVSQPTFTGIPGPRPLARPEGAQLEEISPGHQHIDFIYFARPAGGVAPVLNAAETEAVGWYSAGELASLGLTPEVHAWARRALDTVR